MENTELLPEEVVPAPTTQELINKTQGEMLDVLSQIRNYDYLTHKELDGEDMTKYGDWRGERKKLRAQYNELEKEVERLQILLEEESAQSSELI